MPTRFSYLCIPLIETTLQQFVRAIWKDNALRAGYEGLVKLFVVVVLASKHFHGGVADVFHGKLFVPAI